MRRAARWSRSSSRDYRAVDGVQIAFQATRQVGGRSVERRVTDVKINAPVDPTLFKRPAS